jgi:hypothetical protein
MRESVREVTAIYMVLIVSGLESVSAEEETVF